MKNNNSQLLPLPDGQQQQSRKSNASNHNATIQLAINNQSVSNQNNDGLINSQNNEINNKKFDKQNDQETTKIMQLIASSRVSANQQIARQILDQVINVQDVTGQLFRSKYTFEFVHSLIASNLQRYEKLFKEFQKRGIDVSDFIYIMLNSLDHGQHESLFIVIALIDFFQAISESDRCTVGGGADSDTLLVKWEDITNFITENNPLTAETLPDNRKIASRYLPPAQRFNKQIEQRIIRVIDTKAPLILRDNDLAIRRLNKERLVIDSIHHNNNLIIAAHYASQIKRLITVDSYSDQFLVYTQECHLEKKVQPKTAMVKGQVCIDLCWSEKQSRFGATFRDQFLGFWDSTDGFEFEQIFHIGECPEIIEDQLHLWYLECVDKWVTTDRRNMLFFWNLEQEKVEFTIKSPAVFSKGILQLVEIPYLQMVAVAAQDNLVSLWDFINQKLLFKINVSHNHIHSISFFATFQVLLTAGYDSIINVYSIHPDYNDYNKVGELAGHNSLITAMKGIENSPMIITSDDRFTVKVWDVRKLTCIQNFELELRSPIRFMHVFQDSVCFVSSRITCIYFDEEEQGAGLILQKQKKNKQQQQIQTQQQTHQQTNPTQQSIVDKQQQQIEEISKPIKQEELLFPISIEYNEQTRELFVATKKDVRVYDVFTGQTKRIFGNITLFKEDEVTDFLMFQQHKRILIGSQKGAVKGYSSLNAEELFSSQLHQEQITTMRMDYLNGLLISVSTDASLAVSKPTINSNNGSSTGGAFEKIREVSNVMHGKEITLLEVSVYHNLIVTGNASPCLCLWNYEFGRLIATLILETDNEPTVLQFINGYAILAIGTIKGYIYFVLFSGKEDSFDLDIVSNIQIQKTIYLQQIQEIKNNQGNQEYDQEKVKQQQDLLQSYYQKEDQRRRKSRLIPIGLGQQLQQQQQAPNQPQQKTQRKSQISEMNSSTKSSGNVLKINNQQKNEITNEKRSSAASIRLELLQVQQNNQQNQKISSSTKLEVPRLNLGGVGNNENSDIDNMEEIENDVDNNDKNQNKLHPTKMLIKLNFDNNTYHQESVQKSEDIQQKIQDQENFLNNKIPIQANILLGMNNGEIWDYNITIMFKRETIQLKQHTNKKTNYNAFRHYKDDFDNILNNHKVYSFFIEKSKVRRDILVVDNLKQTDLLKKFKQSVIKLESMNNIMKGIQQDETERPLDPYFALSNNFQNKVKAHKDQLTTLQILPINENILVTASMDSYLRIWKYPEFNLVCSLNITHPLPILWDLKPDFTKEYEGKILFALQAMQCTQDKYKARLTLLQEKKYNIAEIFKYIQQQQINVIEQEKLLIQQQEEEQKQLYELALQQNKSSKKNSIKDLNKLGNSLTEPDVELKRDQKKSVIKLENQRYLQQQQLEQQRNLELQKTKDELENLHQQAEQQQQQVLVMQNFYSPRDLIYDRIRQIYQKELQGPSLKHIAESKRIYNAQLQWKKKMISQEEEEQMHMQQRYQTGVPEDKLKDQKLLVQFLDPNYKDQLLKKKYDFLDRNAYIDKLDTKLDKLLEDKQYGSNVNNNKEQQAKLTQTLILQQNTQSHNQNQGNAVSMLIIPNANLDIQQSVLINSKNSNMGTSQSQANKKNKQDDRRARSIPKFQQQHQEQLFSPNSKQSPSINIRQSLSQDIHQQQKIQLSQNLKQSQILNFLNVPQKQSNQQKQLINSNFKPDSVQLTSTSNIQQFDSTIKSSKKISSQQALKSSFNYQQNSVMSKQQKIKQFKSENKAYYQTSNSPTRKMIAKTETSQPNQLPNIRDIGVIGINNQFLRNLNNDFFAKVEDYGPLIGRDYQFILQAQSRGGMSFFDYAKKKSYFNDQSSYMQNSQIERTNVTADNTNAINNKTSLLNQQEKSMVQNNRTTAATATTGPVTTEVTLTTDRQVSTSYGLKPVKGDNSIQMRKTESKFFGNVIKSMNNKVKKSRGFLVTSQYQSLQTLPQQPLNTYLQQHLQNVKPKKKKQNTFQEQFDSTGDQINIGFSSLIDNKASKSFNNPISKQTITEVDSP